MYNNDDIQRMLEECNKDADLKATILSEFSGNDYYAIVDVLDDGYYERFDRYDSDVCEQFISAYEKAKKSSK